MEKPRIRSAAAFRNAAAVVLLLLLALYVPLRVRMAREDRAPEPCAPGTELGIFFTSNLSGYREPCG
jgi:hypothetical protein